MSATVGTRLQRLGRFTEHTKILSCTVISSHSTTSSFPRSFLFYRAPAGRFSRTKRWRHWPSPNTSAKHQLPESTPFRNGRPTVHRLSLLRLRQTRDTREDESAQDGRMYGVVCLETACSGKQFWWYSQVTRLVPKYISVTSEFELLTQYQIPHFAMWQNVTNTTSK